MPMIKQIRQLALCALFVAAMQSHQAFSQTPDGSLAIDTPTITPTPSLTPVATRAPVTRGRRSPTPFSRPPKFDTKPSPKTATQGPSKRAGRRTPKLKGHRALRDIDDEANEDSSDSVSERR